MGCQITVTLEDGKIQDITGFSCRRGKMYAESEVTAPVRTVTTTVRVTGSPTEVMVSVKTAHDIPKGKMAECMQALRGMTVRAPVHIGDVILKNVAGTGVDIVATKNA